MDYRRFINDFEEDGFIVCRQFFSATEMDAIIERLNDFISNRLAELPREHVFYEDISDRSTLKQIQQLQQHDEYFGELVSSGPLPTLAASLLGDDVVCKNMQYFNKPPKIGKPTPPHQDGYYFKLDPCIALTMWLALEPVDEANGCVRYVSGSHRAAMRCHADSGTLGFSQGITDFPTQPDLQQEVAVAARRGDLLAHHAKTVHWANGNNSATRTRQALGFIYYGSQAKQDTMAHQRYQQQLKHRLVQEGKI